MRRLLLVFLLVVLPLRGWTADVMALAQGLGIDDSAVHALCPDHATLAEGDRVAAEDDGAPGKVHAHCTACQLPAMTAPAGLSMGIAPPAARPAAPVTALAELAPQRQIKPPIA